MEDQAGERDLKEESAQALAHGSGD